MRNAVLFQAAAALQRIRELVDRHNSMRGSVSGRQGQADAHNQPPARLDGQLTIQDGAAARDESGES